MSEENQQLVIVFVTAPIYNTIQHMDWREISINPEPYFNGVVHRMYNILKEHEDQISECEKRVYIPLQTEKEAFDYFFFSGLKLYSFRMAAAAIHSAIQKKESIWSTIQFSSKKPMENELKLYLNMMGTEIRINGNNFSF